MRKKPLSIFIVTMLLLAMLLGAVQFGSEGVRAQTDSSSSTSGISVIIVIILGITTLICIIWVLQRRLNYRIKRPLALNIISGAILCISILYLIPILLVAWVIILQEMPNDFHENVIIAGGVLPLLIYAILGIISTMGLLKLKYKYIKFAIINEIIAIILESVWIIIFTYWWWEFVGITELLFVGSLFILLGILPHILIWFGLSKHSEKLRQFMIDANINVKEYPIHYRTTNVIPQPISNAFNTSVPLESMPINYNSPKQQEPYQQQFPPQYQQPPPPPEPASTYNPPDTPSQNLEAILESAVNMTVPSFIDTGVSVEILVELNNRSNSVLKDVHLDLSDLKDTFEVEGYIFIPTLKSGMQLSENLRIKPKFKEGTFPIIIKISGSGITIEKEYTIKVGGTEVY